MKRSWVSYVLFVASCVLVPAFVTGCGDASAEKEAKGGTATMALSGVSGSGKTYRLRTATFEVTGTVSATASSETDLSASSIVLELKAGGYLAKLDDGWTLELLAPDGTFSTIPAVLTSTNPLPFTVVDQQTTKVLFQFTAGGDVVQLGDGRAEIGIAVTDCAGGACDKDGDGVAPPADCDDNNAAVFPGATEICDGLDNDCNGQVDENGVCGAGGGVCDASGDCNACQQCAEAGDCSAQTQACVNSTDCINLLDCENNCADQPCVDNCQTQFPNGTNVLGAFEQCVTCECQTSCGVPAGSCQ